MPQELEDTTFLKLSPLLALLAAWGTWKLFVVLEAEENRRPPPILTNRLEVAGASSDCGATWVVSVSTLRCSGPYIAEGGAVGQEERYTASMSPMGGTTIPDDAEASCVLQCFGGDAPYAQLVASVTAPEFRGRLRCDPAVGDPIDLYVGPVYTEGGESVALYAWHLHPETLTLFDRLTASCPYVRPEGPGDVPAEHGLW